MSNEKRRYLACTVNSLAAAVIASFCVRLLHSAVQCLCALAFGMRIDSLGTLSVRLGYFGNSSRRYYDIIAAGGASVAVLLAGVGALAVLAFGVRRSAAWRQFWVLLAGFSLLAGFGSFFVGAGFYALGARFDWSIVLRVLGGNAAVIIQLAVVGVIGCIAAALLLAREAFMFAGTERRGERVRLAVSMYLVPYIVLGGALCLASVGSNAGVADTAIRFFCTYAGLPLAFVFSALPTKKNGESGETTVSVSINRIWLIAAIVLFAAQLFLVIRPL